MILLQEAKKQWKSIFKDDPIVIGKDGSVQNGRHRVLASKVLAEVGYDTNWGWVETAYE